MVEGWKEGDRYGDTQDNNAKHNNKNATLCITPLSVRTLIITIKMPHSITYCFVLFR